MARGPTYDPLFDSAWFKWAQAIVHAQALEKDIEVRRTEGHVDPVLAYGAHYDPKRHGFAIVVEDIEEIPIRWRLLLGDIANNFRASIDHLAWAIVSRGRTPPGSGSLSNWQEKSVYFPINETRAEFNGLLVKNLPGARRADIARVRWAQPYHHGGRHRWRHPLKLLTNINTGDKHRTIQPLWAYATRIDLEVTRMRDCVVTQGREWRRQTRPLQGGTEVAFLPARKRGSNPELQVKVKIVGEPSIGQRISIREWQVQTGIFIYKLLRGFSAQPSGIDQIGAELVELPPGI